MICFAPQVEVDEHIVPDETVPLMEVEIGDASLETRRRAADDDQADRRPARGAARLLMHGFADEINEVFHNLIENAVKYGFEATAIEINVSQPEAAGGDSVTNRGEPIAENIWAA